MTLTETCPLKGTGSSFNWTFSANAKLRLPVVCSLSSEKINCDSITLRSSHSKEIHLTHYRMEIVEKKLEEEKVNFNKTVFVKSKISPETYTTRATPALLDSLKLPLIGLGVAIILLIILISAVKLIKGQSNGRVSVNVSNSATSSNISPSCPSTTEVQEEPSKLSHQDAQPGYYYDAMDIAAILAVEPSKRNAFKRRAMDLHSSKLKNNPLLQNQA